MSALSFTKLFSSLTESTLWVEQPHHVRIVWITMLAMADRDGIVAASIPGLARRACVTVAEAEEALKVFLSPDRYSRTPDHEGRRIREVPGGWELLNYAKYRRMQSAELERERKREYMRNRRSSNVAPFPEHVAEVAVGNECSSASSSPSASGSDPDPEGVQREPSNDVDDDEPPQTTEIRQIGPRRWPPSRFAPEDWEPNAAHRVRCQELRFRIDDLVKDFRAQEFNREYTDWDRRFSKWIEDQRVKREAAWTAKAKPPANAPSPGRSADEALAEVGYRK